MLIFFDQRLVFLATPKAGSTAIEAALGSLATAVIQRPTLLKHTNADAFARFLGPYLQEAAGARFTVTALMREPLAWLGSWYRFGQRDDAISPARQTRDVTFDEFVRAWCRETPPEFAQVGRQSDFLQSGGRLAVDRLFRYEDIDSFVHFLEDSLDCVITLPRLNVSPDANMDLSPAAHDLLRRTAAADFALYDRIGAA